MITATLPDIPRVLTGIAEWSACLVYVLLLGRHLPRVRLVAFSVLFLGVQVVVQVVAGRQPLMMWPVGMAVAVLTMLLFLRVAARLPWRAAGYLLARAFVLAELVASFHWQLHCFFFDAAPAPTGIGQIAFLVGVYTAAFGISAAVESRNYPRGVPLDVSHRELALAAAIALVTFGMSNMSFLSARTPFSGRLGSEVFYIRTLVDFGGFVALHAQQGLRLEAQARAELAAIDGVLRTQHAQYLQSKRSIEAVNRTYHDLKHQIAVIRAEDNPQKKTTYLEELEESIRDYATHTRTGNGVLDVLLSTKSAICAEKGIELTCVADGRLLGFMSVMDICSVVGNALDNAIEGTDQVEDADQRLIRMAVYAQGDLVMLVVENYFPGALQLEHGRIVTTKGDPDRHGYGLKSIRHAAEKYGGSMTVRTEQNWFTLRVLLPATDWRTHPHGAPEEQELATP
ncbi:ATP-binding protein [Cellulomonas soli]|uniref:ATP-binding protein n=1 Tax=Cellulomonas soli TaxID=931535 RepID=UPI003F85D017